jgi:hypothetical protein
MKRGKTDAFELWGGRAPGCYVWVGRLLRLQLLFTLTFAACTSERKATSDKPSDRGTTERNRISALIDSLANKNLPPTMVHIRRSGGMYEAPLFSEDYDWQENRRVIDVLNELEKQDKECLWYCIMEHLDDKRYCLTFNFNGEDRIASIGVLCHTSAAGQLAAAFLGGPGSRMPSILFHWRSVGPDDDSIAWRRDHKNIPLYKQQIEMCEAVIKRIQTSDYISKYVPESEESKYVEFIKGQIEKLEREKRPIFSWLGTLTWGIEERYNAKKAEEIRSAYLGVKLERER